MAILPPSGWAQTPKFEPSVKMALGEPLKGFGGHAARLEASLRFKTREGRDPPIVIAGRLKLPRGVAINGRRYAKCSGRLMRESQSTEVCPRTSFMGASIPVPIDDPVGFAQPRFEFINGGAQRIWAFGTIYNPALVQAPMAIDLRKLEARRPWFELSFDVPQAMRVVAGVPVSLTHWPVAVGGRAYASGYVTFDRRCTRRHKLGFEASLTYLDASGSPVEATRRVPVTCRRSLPADDEVNVLEAH